MKLISRFLFIGAIVCGLWPARAQAWEIANFETHISIRSDASAKVSETIRVDFDNEIRHGIYRDIPIHYEDRAGQHFRMRVRVLSVTDESGNFWKYNLESVGRYLRIRIGDPNRVITGVQTFRIVYEVTRGAVRFFPDHDECYWNLTGNEWAVPMRQVRADITLPPSVSDVRAIGFIGAFGSKKQLDQITISDHSVRLEPPQVFYPYEGLTAVVGWEKGAVRPPSLLRRSRWWVEDNWIYGIPVFVLIFMTWLWKTKGRDPVVRKSEMVEYGPPDHLTPAELGTLIDERVDMRDITASVIDLAVRGYVRITPLKTLFWESDYQLQSLKKWEGDSELKPHELAILKAIFGEALISTKLSELKQVFYQDLPKIKKYIYGQLIPKYLTGNPENKKQSYVAMGVTTGMAIGIVLQILSHRIPSILTIPSWIASFLTGIIIVIFGQFMPRRTMKGAELKSKIIGFEEFLKRTDEDKIRRMNDPGLFEKCLPYALAFGVAEQWSKVFSGLFTQPPSWYVGSWDAFSTERLTHDLNRMSYSMNNVFTSQPRTSGGSSSSWGGSGFGGGGFSGGGGGGGGGGAW